MMILLLPLHHLHRQGGELGHPFILFFFFSLLNLEFLVEALFISLNLD